MATQQFTPPPTTFALDQAAHDRRQKLLDSMIAQVFEPNKGFVANGRYYGTNIGDALGKVLSAWVLRGSRDKLDEQQKGISQAYAEQRSRAMQDFLRGMTGAAPEGPVAGVPPTSAGVNPGAAPPTQQPMSGPPQAFPVGGGGLPPGGVAGSPLVEGPSGGLTTPPPAASAPQGLPGGLPAAPLDPRAAAIQAVMSGIPELAKLGEQYLTTGLKSLTPGHVTVDAYGNIVTPRAAAGGDSGWETVNIGGDLYQRTATGLKKLDNAPKVNVAVTGPTISMGKSQGALATKLGEHAAADVADSVKQAGEARKVLANVGRLEKLSGTFTGPQATPAVWLGQVADGLGIKLPKETQDKLTNSQTFAAAATEMWLNTMNTVGGARGLTEPESNRIARALPSLVQTPEGRAQMLQMIRDRAQETIAIAQEKQKAAIMAAQSENPGAYYEALSEANIPVMDMPEGGMRAAGSGGNAPIPLDEYLRQQGGQ